MDMSREEINSLLKEIKIMYPRFDSVDRDGIRFGVSEEVTEAWWKRIGWMDYDQAIRILNRHMESEEGNRVPTIALFMNNGKSAKNASGYSSAIFEKQRGIVRWQPDPEGPVFERPVVWNQQHGCYEDEDGYYWATADEE